MVPRRNDGRGKPNTLLNTFLVGILLVSGSAGLMGSIDTTLDTVKHPFDPPSMAEQTSAASIALADPRVAAAVGDRNALLGVALGTEKVPGVPVTELTRLLDVWYYNYSSDEVVWAVVDLEAQEVTRLVPVPSSFHMPLAAVEIDRARELALDLDDVSLRFPDPLPVTAVLHTGQDSQCPQDRCAIIAFIEENGPVTDHLVLVNLSEDRVERIINGWGEVHA